MQRFSLVIFALLCFGSQAASFAALTSAAQHAELKTETAVMAGIHSFWSKVNSFFKKPEAPKSALVQEKAPVPAPVKEEKKAFSRADMDALLEQEVQGQRQKSGSVSSAFTSLSEEDDQTDKMIREQDEELRESAKTKTPVEKIVRVKQVADKHAEDYWGSLQKEDLTLEVSAQSEESAADAFAVAPGTFGLRR
eukprot:TRINITY_DN21163_c2_g1_i1.p1 TRINITY_DN21163_c2_g1~~TRINITY_DN21163_c2_g1_i1.p1  ORF type:complete len:194 (-),score=62.29 TRINITY_DN21163_c2_g1_i1:104-685(-)